MWKFLAFPFELAFALFKRTFMFFIHVAYVFGIHLGMMWGAITVGFSDGLLAADGKFGNLDDLDYEEAVESETTDER